MLRKKDKNLTILKLWKNINLERFCGKKYDKWAKARSDGNLDCQEKEIF